MVAEQAIVGVKPVKYLAVIPLYRLPLQNEQGGGGVLPEVLLPLPPRHPPAPPSGSDGGAGSLHKGH